VTWIGELKEEESKDKVVLYSTLLQNLSEMVASIEFKLSNQTSHLPEHIKSSIDLMKIFKELESVAKTKSKKFNLFAPSGPGNYQWERILQVSNIPNYFNE
jgi:hypothetical protein